MMNLLRDAIHQRKTKITDEIDICKIKEQFNILIKQDLGLLDKKFESLRKSLEKYSDHLFMFLKYEDASSDNNASERNC